MRVQQVLSEAALGLRRNLIMTGAAIVTISISLAFLGTALLTRTEVNRLQDSFLGQIEVSVFLTKDVTQAQRDDVRASLEALPLVEKPLIYESKADAYKRFKEQFKDQPALVELTTEDVLPESFRVKLTDPTKYAVVQSRLCPSEGLCEPGVDQVIDQQKFLDPFFRILNGLRDMSIALAAVQLVAAMLLIANTVRVAAFSRRRETGVMRLVGATRLYIQLPFLLEGIIAGAVGAALGTGLLAAGKAVLLDRELSSFFEGGIIPPVTWTDIALVFPVLLAAGVVISGLASLLTLRRYVRL